MPDPKLIVCLFVVLILGACRAEEQGRVLGFDKTYSGDPMPLIDKKVRDELRQRVAKQDF